MKKDYTRSHYCGRISESDIDTSVTAMGWVHTNRDMGGIIFIDLRDKSGILQVVFDSKDFSEEEFSEIEGLRNEYVIAVSGNIRERDEETYNPKIPTGTVELKAKDFKVLSKSKTLPFPIDDNVDVREDLRMKHRYLDLRRPKMYKNFLLRNNTLRSIRRFLEDNEFMEVETPILTKSTPEGARDYLVPSRVHQGEFYALPQSPQIFKQLLMVSGFDKYYQVARCFRDEDLRADRQPEFTQIDMETSFLSQEEILNYLEKLFKNVFKEVMGIDFKEPFPRITYQEAMDNYGSDKPDIRFGLKIVDVTEEIRSSSFKVFTDTLKLDDGSVRAINIKGGNAFTRTEIEDMTEYAISQGAKGMAWIAIDNDGNLRTILTKYFSEEDMTKLLEKMEAKPGDLIIFSADKLEVVYKTLGNLRLYVGDKLCLRKKDDYKFLMVVDFPQFEYSEEEDRYVAMHHPFTMPVEEDIQYLESDPLKVRAQSYDVVLNGIELGSGSLRIYRSDIQEKMFKLLGISDEEIQRRFGFIIEAFQYGTPPHGGFAFGLDRLIMLMAKEDSIREVIAFPKNRDAQCLLSEAPSTVDDSQLEDLGIGIVGENGFIKESKSVKEVATEKLEDIKSYADMSMLNIDEVNEVRFKTYINDFIDLTKTLRELDLTEYEPTVNIHPVDNTFRKDIVQEEFSRDELLGSSYTDETGHILVPRLIED